MKTLHRALEQRKFNIRCKGRNGNRDTLLFAEFSIVLKNLITTFPEKKDSTKKMGKTNLSYQTVQ